MAEPIFNPTTPPTPVSTTLMEWSFSETPRYQRGLVWYFVTGLMVAVLIGYGIISGNILFSLIIFLSALIFYLSYRSGRVVTCAIDTNGITVGKKYYPFSEIEKFWVIYKPPAKNLYLHHKGSMFSIITLPLENQNPVQTREILLRYLPEDLEAEEEPFLDTLTRLFKL